MRCECVIRYLHAASPTWICCACGAEERVKSIELKEGQEVLLRGHSDSSCPDTFHGWQTPTQTVIGISLTDLADIVRRGNLIKMQDGMIALKVGLRHSASVCSSWRQLAWLQLGKASVRTAP
jgi:hypothetical protein